jgi:hypothetical protein
MDTNIRMAIESSLVLIARSRRSSVETRRLIHQSMDAIATSQRCIAHAALCLYWQGIDRRSVSTSLDWSRPLQWAALSCLAEASPRLDSSRTAAARLGILA